MGPVFKLGHSRFCVFGGAERPLKVLHERGEQRVSSRGWINRSRWYSGYASRFERLRSWVQIAIRFIFFFVLLIKINSMFSLNSDGLSIVKVSRMGQLFLDGCGSYT
jgi:hypothetical protein